jgi:MarR family transcriptional regulator, organic hydroperoxide resistance regulator
LQTSKYPCLCAGFRKAGRVLTKKYDNYLKPSGLKITQYSMLANIARNPGITVSRLAELLIMDQTTVSRNLQVLEKAGCVNIEAGATDNRVRKIQISGNGVSKMKQAKPLWETAQLEVEGLLGSGGVTEIMSAFRKITG